MAVIATSGERRLPSVARAMNLDLLGLDRPGLVREISQLLSQHGVNVEELTTDRTSAPMSGEMLFRAQARVKVPADVDPTRLRQRIERLATDLTIEIRLLEDDRV
jgi:glycine cleavage system regulatory protein